jgi:hypothetical protein
MKFRTRTKRRVLVDLTSKLQDLPEMHPDRSAIIRMIEGLKEELALQAGAPTPPETE